MNKKNILLLLTISLFFYFVSFSNPTNACIVKPQKKYLHCETPYCSDQWSCTNYYSCSLCGPEEYCCADGCSGTITYPPLVGCTGNDYGCTYCDVYGTQYDCIGGTECTFYGWGNNYATKIVRGNIGPCGNEVDEIGATGCQAVVADDTWDGAKCYIAFGWTCEPLPFDERFDASEDICADCNWDDHTQGTAVCNPINYGAGKCESACGAHSDCDEIGKGENCKNKEDEPYKGYCDNQCQCIRAPQCDSDDDCNTNFGYECDTSTKKCVKCDLNNVQTTGTVADGKGKCEAGGDTTLPNQCGADSSCDEKIPGVECETDCEPLPICVYNNPTVSILPETQSHLAGNELTYTVNVTNNNNPACEDTTFTLTYSCPTGWTECSLDSTSFKIPSKESKTTVLHVISPLDAEPADYTISVTAESGEYSGMDTTIYTVEPNECFYDNPNVSVIPQSQIGANGTELTYVVNVTNNNNKVCNDSIFILTNQSPDENWVCYLNPEILTIFSGESETSTLSVTSPFDIVAGCYTISVIATNETESIQYTDTGEAYYIIGLECEYKCDGICPEGCTVDKDPDCGCVSGNGCCGITDCNSKNDKDCPVCTDTDGGIEPLNDGICTDETNKCKNGCEDDCSSYSVVEYYCNKTTHKCENVNIDCRDYSKYWCSLDSPTSICDYRRSYQCWWPDWETAEGGAQCMNLWGTRKTCSYCSESRECKVWECPYTDFTWTCHVLFTTPIVGNYWMWTGSIDGNLTDPEDIYFGEYSCDDGYDNDCDNNVDCDDSDCAEFCAPTTSIKCNNEDCLKDCWYEDVEVSLICSGGKTTCDKTYYCYDKTDSCMPNKSIEYEYSLPFSLPEGINYVRYFSTDKMGWTEEIKSQEVKVSKIKPLEPYLTVINLGPERKPIDLSYTISPSAPNIKVNFEPNPIPEDEYYSKMIITVGHGTSKAVYTITIKGIADKGTSNEIVRTITYKLTVV